MASKKYDYTTLYLHNSSGHRGVSFDKSRNQWEVKVGRGGQRKRVGRYKTLDEAVAAHRAYISEQ